MAFVDLGMIYLLGRALDTAPPSISFFADRREEEWWYSFTHHSVCPLVSIVGLWRGCSETPVAAWRSSVGSLTPSFVFVKKESVKTDMVMHAYDCSTGEAEAGGSRI